jgi:hypothetical protein
MNKIIFSLMVLFLTGSVAKAQDLVYLLNGDRLYVSIIDTAGKAIKVEEPVANKKGRKDNAELEKDRIFSIQYRTGQEVIYYAQDSISDSDDKILTVEEMRSYIAGQHDAHARYHSPGVFWGSFATGLASGLFLPVFYSPIPPLGMSVFLGSRWIKVSREHISDPKYLKDEFYIMGYEKAARNRRVKHVINGSVAGLFVGILAGFTLFNQAAN